MLTKIKPVLGEIVIRYDNNNAKSIEALEQIEQIATNCPAPAAWCSDDCEDDQRFVIVTVASVEVAVIVRAIVAEAPADVKIVRDDVATTYTPTTAGVLRASGADVVGDFGDEECIDDPGVWRIAATPDGLRLEVLECRDSCDSEWHEAERLYKDDHICPLSEIVRAS